MTGTESTIDPGDGLVGDNPERQAAADFNQAWAHKVGKFDKGSYQGFPSGCDLAIYDNTETEPLTCLADVLHKLAPPRELLGRFRQVHIARGDRVVLDVFGNRRRDIDLSRHYDIDFAGWAFDQAARLRDGGVEGLDVEHLAEELESLGRSDRRALGSHIRNLLLHLLKWRYQPELRGDSWRSSIDNARAEIIVLLTDIPSLRSQIESILVVEYGRAARLAAAETGMERAQFPEGCPHDLKARLLDPEYLP